jgi:hypothetical protein
MRLDSMNDLRWRNSRTDLRRHVVGNLFVEFGVSQIEFDLDAGCCFNG